MDDVERKIWAEVFWGRYREYLLATPQACIAEACVNARLVIEELRKADKIDHISHTPLDTPERDTRDVGL
jgi:hypothetical protein